MTQINWFDQIAYWIWAPSADHNLHQLTLRPISWLWAPTAVIELHQLTLSSISWFRWFFLLSKISKVSPYDKNLIWDIDPFCQLRWFYHASWYNQISSHQLIMSSLWLKIWLSYWTRYKMGHMRYAVFASYYTVQTHKCASTEIGQ